MEGLVKISVHLLCRGRIQESAVDWRWRAAVAWKTVDYVRIVDDRGQARPRKKSKEYNKRHQSPKRFFLYRYFAVYKNQFGSSVVVRLGSLQKTPQLRQRIDLQKKQGDDDDDDDDS